MEIEHASWDKNFDESDDEDYTPGTESYEIELQDEIYFEKEAIKEDDLDEHLIEPYDVNLEHYSQMRDQFIPKHN